MIMKRCVVLFSLYMTNCESAMILYYFSSIFSNLTRQNDIAVRDRSDSLFEQVINITGDLGAGSTFEPALKITSLHLSLVSKSAAWIFFQMELAKPGSTYFLL